MRCGDCNKTHPPGWKLCRYCKRCSHSCRCRRRPKFLSELYKAESKANGVVNSLPRSLALEIELSQWGGFDKYISKLLHADQIWFSKHTAKVFDRSITSSYELVVSPSSKDEYLRSATQVYNSLINAGAVVDNTCGYHVHVNASEFNSIAIRNILWLWAKYRNEMAGKLFDAERLNGAYCKDTAGWLHNTLPVLAEIKNPKVLRAAILYIMAHGARFFGTCTGSAIAAGHQKLESLNDGAIGELIPGCVNAYGELTPARSLAPVVKWIKDNNATDVSKLINRRFDLARNHYNPVRYSSVNIASLWYRGSLEFRIKEGTLDKEDFLMWPLFVGWLTHIAGNQSWSWVRKTTEYYNLKEFVKYQFADGTRLFPIAVAEWVGRKLER